MKNSKRLIFLSLAAIAFVLGAASCGKANLKKDLDGSWTLNKVTQNGVDVFADMGATLTGTWIFDKKAKTCNITNTLSYTGGPSETNTDDVTYTVEDKETIVLDGETFTVTTLTSSTLVLTITDGSDVTQYNFTK